MGHDDGGASGPDTGGGAGGSAGTSGIGGGSGVGGASGVGGSSGVGGARGGGGSGGSGVGGGTGTGGADGGSAVCSNGSADNCGHALGAHGTCAAGSTTCTGGQWGPCSVQPRTADTCVAGNDDTCDGRANEGCVCDGYVPPADHPNPTSYDPRLTGIVIDTATGLAWQSAVPTTTYVYSDAGAYCVASRLGGFADWRLPTVVELDTIVDYSVVNPSINSTSFPATPTEFFWASNPIAGFPTRAWAIRFIRGEALDNDNGSLSRVRCVRRILTPRCYLPPRFQVAGGLVTDAATGLTWQQAVSPQGMTWDAARAYCAAQTGGFRLATVRELQSIVDYTKAMPGPAIDTTAFPGTPGVGFWSSTPLAGVTGSAWEVVFDGGAILQNGGTVLMNRARCVR